MFKLLAALILAGTFISQSQADRRLDPDFEVASEEVSQVFREELTIALAKTPGATPETRVKFKKEAEKIAADVFLRGQKMYDLPRKKLKVYWDKHDSVTLADSAPVPVEFSLHLNEVMFFTHHYDHLSLVIPHEVTHMVHYQRTGATSENHDAIFVWMVERIAPGYYYKEFDMTPACRLSARMLVAGGNTGSSQNCRPPPPK
jgi:hypothetical protein